jgi:hypothetical protein
MAEPKKETVRIALPPRPEQAGAGPSIAKSETTRIVLPTRTPVAPIRRPPQIAPLPAAETTADAPTILRRPPTITPANTSPLLQPLPKPPGGEIEDAPVPPTESPMIHRGPKKETARISILPKPAATPAPAINMTKTQPLLVHPPATGVQVQSAPVIITSKPLVPVEAIPRPLCWAVFGISALIFLIQIWNYVVS